VRGLAAQLITSIMLLAAAPQQPPSTPPKTVLSLDTDHYCSSVALHFKLLRQPPTYHVGERIQARLSFTSTNTRPNGYDLALEPRPRRRSDPFTDALLSEPQAGTVDPSGLAPRILAGSWLGSYWRGTTPLVRDIDVNEWIQFRRSGRYVLHATSRRIARTPPRGETPCELKSNHQPIEILPPDSQWEAAELARITGLLGSTTGMTRFRAASDLRYLGTRDAAVALARWYVRLQVGDAVAELRDGIFESPYPDAAQAELEAALRSGAPLPAEMADTLATLELQKEFVDRPIPADSKASRDRANEYWGRFAVLKQKYSAEIAQRIR
jgi:hypothetical protein